MRLAILTTILILIFFGLVFCGLYGYRKYKDSRRPKECVIRILRDGSLQVYGRELKLDDLRDFLNRQDKKYDKSPLEQFYVCYGPPNSNIRGAKYSKFSTNYPVNLRLAKEQPFTPRFDVDADCIFSHIQQILGSHHLNNGKTVPILQHPGRGSGSGPPTIDLQEVRVKLLWYSPVGRPRYKKEDGKIVLKIKSKVFGSQGNPDWKEMARYINQKMKEYRPPSSNPNKRLPVIVDARESVPSKFIFKALDTLKATKSCGIISIAVPEIPY
jgi:hypothetical protein